MLMNTSQVTAPEKKTDEYGFSNTNFRLLKVLYFLDEKRLKNTRKAQGWPWSLELKHPHLCKTLVNYNDLNLQQIL